MSNIRVVPWKNRKEFKCVYKEVFGNDWRCQQHGVGRIDVWRSRALHKISVAIESTAAIVHAVINHQRAAALGKVAQQDNEIRSLYSVALIRFVNHITEKGQTKGYAVPVHLIANQFGVPEWIVELRHSATHGKPPPLPMLTAACEWALAWLKREFWEEQLCAMETASRFRKRKERRNRKLLDVRSFLENYQQEKFLELKEKTIDKSSSKILRGLQRIPTESRDKLVSCATEDGFLIPTKEQLDALQIDYTSLESPSGCKVPVSLVVFWKPFLQHLHYLKLTDRLLITLASRVTREQCFQNNILCGWIKIIVLSNKQAVVKSAKRKTTQLYKCSADLSFSPVLGHLMHTVCAHTMPVIKRLFALGLKTGQYTNTQVGKLTQLMKLVQRTTKLKQDGTYRLGNANHTIHTVEDIAESRKRKLSTSEDITPAKRPCVEVPNLSVWTRCEDKVDWSQVPIGQLPGQTLDYMTLDLSTHSEQSLPDCDDDDSDDEDETDEETMQFEEDVYKDVEETQKSSWSFVQMEEIKNSICLL